MTVSQRKRYLQTRVSGHLRKPSEGIDRGFTKPRQKHSFLGLPSVTVIAAVAKDKVIMWHVVQGSWNGAAAANMYKNSLAPALRRTWGRQRRYTIVEDGDRKGNQSTKGINAKIESKIDAMTLPPRTPSLMPLDYAIWKKILDIMVDTAPTGAETKEQFLRRLEYTAKHLPRGFIAKQIDRMQGNIKALVDAKGYHPKND